MRFKDLPPSNRFCPLPWIGSNITPSGTFASCCLQWDDWTAYPGVREYTVEEIRTHPAWNQIRRDLINGVPHQSCDYCWQLENRDIKSPRQTRIEQFGYLLDDLDIPADGSLAANTPVRFWDLRDTNLCNMKCIMCGPAQSSLWAEEALKHDTIFPPLDGADDSAGVIHASDSSKEDLLSTVLANLKHAHSFYFAGGEPLISRMHWDILEALTDQKLFHIYLAYTTNASKLAWRGRDVLAYWEKFQGVNACASIDAVGPRAEYARYGTNWSVIDSNIMAIKERLPHVLSITVTTSLFTIGGLPETLQWIDALGIEDPSKIYKNNVVYGPLWANMKILPSDLKDYLWSRVYRQLEADQQAYESIRSELFDELDDETLRCARRTFKKNIIALDRIRGVSIRDACPELITFIESIDQ